MSRHQQATRGGRWRFQMIYALLQILSLLGSYFRLYPYINVMDFEKICSPLEFLVVNSKQRDKMEDEQKCNTFPVYLL